MSFREDGAMCMTCGREFPVKDGFLDLRPDELREGSATWTPGPHGWSTGILERLVGKPRAWMEALPAVETLDIGCGDRPTGSVNVDVYIPQQPGRNFLLAAADQLPFLPKTFDRVVSRYVIEHLVYPVDFLLHCMMLAREDVDVLTDNSDWLGDSVFRVIGRGRIFHPEHVYKWSREYLENLCRRSNIPGIVTLETLSETPLVKVVGDLARGPILRPLLNRDLRLRIDTRRFA